MRSARGLSAFFAATCITVAAAGAAPAPPAPAKAAASATPAPSGLKLSKWQQQILEKFKNSAPADEYFGRMKMSFLGMNNTFRDAAISAGDHTTDSGIINKVALAEDALEAWAKKYPRDPQLARTYFLATQVDRKIWTKANQERAWLYLNRVVTLFPDSFFGKTLKTDLALGFTEHYYALPMPCATPPPTPLPAPTEADASIDATPAPPAAEPTGEPTSPPTPSPTVTTIAKGLRVEIIAQACVPPPRPSPSPSPLPSASASPSQTESPAGTDPSPAPALDASPVPNATPTPNSSPTTAGASVTRNALERGFSFAHASPQR